VKEGRDRKKENEFLLYAPLNQLLRGAYKLTVYKLLVYFKG
jgi:hypothetical protein